MYLLGDDQRNTYLFHIKILCPALVQKRNWVIITQQPRLKILSVIYVLVPSPPLKRGCKHWNSCPLPNDTQTVLLVLLLPPSSSVHHVRFFHARFRSLQVATTLQFANTVFLTKSFKFIASSWSEVLNPAPPKAFCLVISIWENNLNPESQPTVRPKAEPLPYTTISPCTQGNTWK